MIPNLDRELNIRFIVGFAIVLTLITVGMAALMWGMSAALRDRLEGLDPAPPKLPAARVQPLPPEPRLQASPEADMAAMRAEEELLLSSFHWVDENAGIARVPIETAIELMATQPESGSETKPHEEEPDK